MIRRVNFYGGPGVGKSTMATHVFSELKKNGYKVEYAHEFVKLWAYQKRTITAEDQVTIYNRQHEIESIPLKAGVQAVISDSPLPLVLLYSKGVVTAREHAAMCQSVKDHEREFPSFNIVLQRDTKKPYICEGRWQTREDALDKDAEIEKMLRDNSISYYTQPSWCFANAYELAIKVLSK